MTSAQEMPDRRVEGIDALAFREAVGHFASGITIIGGYEEGEPVGFTCQSFYSVSIRPPLISFSVMLNSTTYPRIRRSGKFSVNVLSNSQAEISNQFACKGGDKWSGVDWDTTSNENPVIAETLMWLDCSIFAEHEAGDHCIVIGRVNQLSPPEWHAGEPLVYFKSQYRNLAVAEARKEVRHTG